MRLTRAHQGDVGVAGFDGDCHVLSLDEQRKKRKSKGMCPTCGEVRTHKPGIWKSKLPETIDGLVYKGICLKCNSLDAAKMKLCEPIEGPQDMYGASQSHVPTSRPSIIAKGRSMYSQDSNPRISQNSNVIHPQDSNLHCSDSKVDYCNEGTPACKRLSVATKQVIALQKFQDIHEQASSKGGKLEDDSTDNDGGPETSMNSLTENLYQDYNESGIHSKTTTSFHSRTASNISENSHDVKPSQRHQKIGTQAKQNSNWGYTKKKVSDFRCSDISGESGFYTGTVVSTANDEEEYLPHGRGEMVYDEGKIAKGVWSNGLLKIQVPSDRERYEPFLLPDYSIGDMGHKEDMMNLGREEATFAVSLLHVNDCAFIRRSDGTWSYSIVKSRTDGQSPAITFQVNSRGSTKAIKKEQWGDHVRTPVKPDTLPQYSIGDPGIEEDMIIESSKTDTVKAVSLLRIGDAAFVKRSDGSWAYSLVVDRSGADIKFKVNERGSTKVIEVLQCSKFVRRVKQNSNSRGVDGLTEQEASAIFKEMD